MFQCMSVLQNDHLGSRGQCIAGPAIKVTHIHDLGQEVANPPRVVFRESLGCCVLPVHLEVTSLACSPHRGRTSSRHFFTYQRPLSLYKGFCHYQNIICSPLGLGVKVFYQKFFFQSGSGQNGDFYLFFFKVSLSWEVNMLWTNALGFRLCFIF